MRKNRWRLKLRYEILGRAVMECFDSWCHYRYARHHTHDDQWAEDMHDMIGTYCAGGEL
jgi:hypothetical protein